MNKFTFQIKIDVIDRDWNILLYLRKIVFPIRIGVPDKDWY